MNGYSLPLLRGVLPLDTSKLTGDIVAGVTLAALGIPEVMGYTKIAGTPIVTGLYTLLLPVTAFALLGGSRHLVVAADSATAAILASILVGIAVLGSPEYVGATSLVALVVAGMLVLARVFRLGFLADFLSRSALIGFLTGVGIQVAGGGPCRFAQGRSRSARANRVSALTDGFGPFADGGHFRRCPSGDYRCRPACASSPWGACRSHRCNCRKRHIQLRLQRYRHDWQCSRRVTFPGVATSKC